MLSKLALLPGQSVTVDEVVVTFTVAGFHNGTAVAELQIESTEAPVLDQAALAGDHAVVQIS